MAWFLGAGASAASGIPTGYAMIRDFKAQIFCRETNLSKREIDTADPVWIDRIMSFSGKLRCCRLAAILRNVPRPSKRCIQKPGIADNRSTMRSLRVLPVPACSIDRFQAVGAVDRDLAER